MRSFLFAMNPTSMGLNSYTSCIKIAGIPILPPLIDDEQRRLLMELKKKAVMVENRVRERQRSREQLTLSRKDSGIFTDTTCSPKDVVPQPASNEESGSDCLILSANKENFVPPKLVRQKSYTLDSPCPQLLAFIEREKKEKDKKLGSLKRTHTWAVSDTERRKSTDFKPFTSSSSNIRRSRKNWNLEEAKTKWKTEKKIKIVINKSPKTRKLEKSASLSYSCPTSPLEVKNENVFSPITNLTRNVSGSNLKPTYCTSTPGRFEKVISNCEPIQKVSSIPSTPVSPVSCTTTLRNSVNSECIINQNTIPITPERDTTSGRDSKQDFELSQDILSFSDHSIPINSSNICDDTMSMCSSVSLNKYMSNDAVKKAHVLYSDLKLLHEHQFEELLRRHELEKQDLFSRLSNLFVNADQSFSSQSSHQISLTLPPSRLSETSFELTDRTEPVRSIRKHLFPPLKCALDYSEQEKRAAIIITAYAKGYLVRRLFKTRRVEQIVLSIKDSISCALKLHKEENLTPADIDLHGRLIAQMTAGLFALDDVFNMPVIQKMAVIKADREIRKTSRPSSGQTLSSVTRKLIARKQNSNTEITSQKKDKVNNKKVPKKILTNASSSTEKISRSSSRMSSQPWR